MDLLNLLIYSQIGIKSSLKYACVGGVFVLKEVKDEFTQLQRISRISIMAASILEL